MSLPRCVNDKTSLLRFLLVPNHYDLDEGLVWAETPQGGSYWSYLYTALFNKRVPPNLEEAKNHIRGFLGLPLRILEEEAEWE